MYYVELSLFITVIIRQQRVNEPFQMSTSGVCSVKFIARDQWFAVAAGDAKGWVHVFNNSCFERKKKVETFEAHPDNCVDSLAVHPTYPILLSSSCEDSMIKRWDWNQGWACTRIFEGHTSGVRCLAFNPRDTNNFASIGLDDDIKVCLFSTPSISNYKTTF
jgi:coatomer subunit beta'